MQPSVDFDPEFADPIDVIRQERTWQRHFCDELERLADQLGGPLDTNLCTTLNTQLQSKLPLYHRDEEALFELMRQKEPENEVLAACTAVAISQHVAMQTFVFELQEPLGDVTVGVALGNPDTVGYMLRYCFDGIRHHLKWEDASIFRGQSQHFPTADMEQLRQEMIRNRL